MPEQKRKTEQDNKPIAFRLPTVARKQLDDLMALWGENQTQTLIRCIERIYQQESKNMTYNRRQHLINAIANQIDLILDQPELIEAKNKAGFTVDVRWQDGEYVSDSDWTRVSDIHLEPHELQQAIQIASR